MCRIIGPSWHEILGGQSEIRGLFTMLYYSSIFLPSHSSSIFLAWNEFSADPPIHDTSLSFTVLEL
jgi:hypothetical protein